jgi:O-succinylbenzoic acid--CoA ligase
LRVLEVPDGPEALEAILVPLADALAGTGPPIAPVPPLPHPRRTALLAALRPDEPLEVDDVAVVLATGGSTGSPKGVLLTRGALQAAAERQGERLGPPGLWVLALPAWHMGGLQVLVRALHGRVPPMALDLGRPFSPEAFGALTEVARQRADAEGVPLYVSLVPTQVARLVAAGTGHLAAYDGVLVGAAAAPPELLAGLRQDDIRMLESYGMSETCGGYAYDGVPIRDVSVELVGHTITVSGPTLFSGYRSRPDLTRQALVAGRFRTPDLGRWNDGRLELLGRADDMIVTGGEKVGPNAVAGVLLASGAAEAAVLGVPDQEWGHAVVAFVVAEDTVDPGTLREAVRRQLGRAAVPRRIHLLDELPTTPAGKLDRAGLLAVDASYIQKG